MDFIFKNNPIIPKGQEKDVQRGIYYGLTGRMSDALDKLAPKVENIIRNLAEMCGDLMTYYDSKEGVQQKKVLSQVFIGESLMKVSKRTSSLLLMDYFSRRLVPILEIELDMD